MKRAGSGEILQNICVNFFGLSTDIILTLPIPFARDILAFGQIGGVKCR